jgi:hypothetical protein
MSRSAPALLVALALAGASASCGDPVHDDDVAALGPEAPGVSPGPDHRPGQPCLVCHGGAGPASAQFSFGGTIYEIPGSTVGYGGATVKLTDANKLEATATTNSVGNFYVFASQYGPTFPVDVELDQGATFKNPMFTHIGRNGSCAWCHFGSAGPTTPGHVYMAGTISDLPGGGSQ